MARTVENVFIGWTSDDWHRLCQRHEEGERAWRELCREESLREAQRGAARFADPPALAKEK